jgi:flavin reductase (DIM6/NTAB) family NADH-FMN oxidoreductase RutF
VVPHLRNFKEFDVAFDSQKQRKIMSRFATGVTVASTAVDGETWGMTANAVASLSLEPPLVLLAVVRGTPSHRMFTRGRCFALNILAADQQDLSIRFSSPGPKDFSELDSHSAATGAPILADALGWVDCRIVQILPGGDHDVFIGEILDGGCRDGKPLLYFGSRYRELAD